MKEVNLVNFVVIEGKLLLFAYISWKKFYSHTFKTPSEEVIVMRFYKMKAKYMKAGT